jgi:hypothetical protein
MEAERAKMDGRDHMVCEIKKLEDLSEETVAVPFAGLPACREAT